MFCFLTDLPLAVSQLALELPGWTMRSCENNTFVSFSNSYKFLFSCTIVSVAIFRTILDNGYQSGNNGHPDFHRNVSNVLMLSKILVLHFLYLLGDATSIHRQGPRCFQPCNVFNYYRCEFCQMYFYHQ